jgi:hypothetical protein
VEYRCEDFCICPPTFLGARISQGADISHLPKLLDEEHGFRTRSRFFFHDMITIGQPPSPLLYLLDVLMGALHIGRWFDNDALKFLERLLDTHASHV